MCYLCPGTFVTHVYGPYTPAKKVTRDIQSRKPLIQTTATTLNNTHDPHDAYAHHSPQRPW